MPGDLATAVEMLCCGEASAPALAMADPVPAAALRLDRESCILVLVTEAAEAA